MSRLVGCAAKISPPAAAPIRSYWLALVALNKELGAQGGDES
jgi:hypothetical protein